MFTMRTRVICFVLLFSSFTNAKGPDERVVLVSFPRSGRTWLLYSLHHLAPNYYVEQSQEFQNRFRFYKNTRATKTVFPTHRLDRIKKFMPDFPKDHDKLILLVRNHRECFLREARDDPALAVDCVKNNAFFTDLFGILQYYDGFIDRSKLLIYYEDLIADPATTFSRILEFLGESKEKLEPFLQSIEQHKQISLRAYEKTYGSASKGKDLEYHTNIAPPAVVEEIDTIVQTKYPDLWEKYLSRFSQ